MTVSAIKKWFIQIWNYLHPLCWFCQKNKVRWFRAHKVYIRYGTKDVAHKICESCIVDLYRYKAVEHVKKSV